MKNLAILTFIVLSIASCKENPSNQKNDIGNAQKPQTIDTLSYPETLLKIFEAHGGLETWVPLENLYFELEKESGNEIHTTSLKNRKTKIEHENWTIGYDGSEVWLQQQKEEAYQGNARFYHNLMFYFYAMPFILADDGIQYEAVEKRELAGVTYEGIKISYDNGVGDSPEDEYILFYDAETYQMEWLGYTVTYGKEGKSDIWKYIKYSAWQDVNGLQLPKTLTWFNVEEGEPTTRRNDLNFINVTATETVLDDGIFKKPAEAVVVPK